MSAPGSLGRSLVCHAAIYVIGSRFLIFYLENGERWADGAILGTASEAVFTPPAWLYDSCEPYEEYIEWVDD